MGVHTFQVAPTIGTAAYTANDVVGGLMTFKAAGASGGGVIRSIIVTDAANQKEPYSLYIFNAAPTTIADDAAFAPAIADLKKLVDVVALGTADYTTVNSLAYAVLGSQEDTPMGTYFQAMDGNLYMYAVAGDTPDYAAATDLSFTMVIEELYA